MDNKLKQAADTIHGTIFLSNFEAEMIATPYFYRLHDIYQSSTVYMTYPANRTKRYEHSLGVMQLASKMIFSALANADNNTTDKFFEELTERFSDVFELSVSFGNNMNVGGVYYENIRDYVNANFRNYDIDAFWNDVTSVRSSLFYELALNQFQYYASDSIQRYFMYRCLLQAVRIVALFHDVGHPPFSHIIEETLVDLYNDEDKKGWLPQKKKDFIGRLRYFISDEQVLTCHSIYVNKALNNAKMHERAGFSLLQHALRAVAKRVVESYVHHRDEKARVSLIYFTTVAEFSMAILAEKDEFFKSIHSIVDGIIDADRLDYIVRDTMNSGVNFGDISYERLTTPLRMSYYSATKEKVGQLGHEAEHSLEQSRIVFAFPQKVEDDITDVLYTRYKLFSRINFHHTCMKTASALKASVKALALDYLTHEDEQCINPDIAILWNALSHAAGNFTLRIMQWNDSFLISTLHNALLNIPEHRNAQEENLKVNLEEILLNTKRYYSVIKRAQDCKRFIDSVFKKLGISEKNLEDFKGIEYHKMLVAREEEAREAKTSVNIDDKTLGIEDNIFSSDSKNCEDSVRRSRSLITLQQTGDLELLEACGLRNAYDIFKEELEKMKCDETISDYRSIKNSGRNNTGLPDENKKIFLYDSEGKIFILDENVSLRPQIEAMRHCAPWIYVYVKPSEKTNINYVFNRLVDAVVEEFKLQKLAIFGREADRIFGASL